MTKHEITITIDVPDGYEPTGEFRPPKDGELWLSVDRRSIKCFEYEKPRIILRKVQPPIADADWQDWVPEGAWYARDENGSKWLFENEPFLDDDGWSRETGQILPIGGWPFENFPHPPESLHWTKTLCQKPRKDADGHDDD